MWSQRFLSEIRLTFHATQRMRERNIPEHLLLDLIESGTLKFKDDVHFWVYKAYPERQDNLLCAAVVLDEILIVKTIMHYFDLEDLR